MPTDLDVNSTAVYCALVSFSWGDDPTITRYCGIEHELTIGDDTFLPAPKLTWTAETQTGSPKDSPWTIVMSKVPPFDKLTRDFPHAPVTCTIEECDILDPASTRRILFAGRVIQTIGNADGQPGIVKAVIGGWKRDFSIKLGIYISDRCPWNFGDSNCCVNLEAVRKTARVTGIVNRTVSLIADDLRGNWQFGEMYVDGLPMRIASATIPEEDFMTGDFVLDEPPPPEWADVVVRLTPGCDKKAATCKDVWSNIERFGGIGIQMPDYQPQYESKT